MAKAKVTPISAPVSVADNGPDFGYSEVPAVTNDNSENEANTEYSDYPELSAPPVSTMTAIASTLATTGKKLATGPAIAADITGTVLTLTFSDGRAIELDATRLVPDMQMAAMLHGLKQKLVDAAAIARDTETGRSATLTDKFEAVKEIFDRITGDEPSWNKVREGGVVAGSNLLIRALMKMGDKSRETVELFLAKKSKEEKMALRKNTKVAAIILELQAAGGNKNIDTDSMLDDLMG